MIKEIIRGTKSQSNIKHMLAKSPIPLNTMPNLHSSRHTSRNSKPPSISPKKISTHNSLSKNTKPHHISNQTSLLSTKDTIPHQRKHHFIKHPKHSTSPKHSSIKHIKPPKNKKNNNYNPLIFNPINKYNNIVLLTQIHDNINIPNQKQFQEKNIMSRHYAKNISSLSNNLSMMNNELSYIKENNVVMERNNKVKMLDTHTWKIENGFIEKEVCKLKMEVEKMQKEVFRLNKGMVILNNKKENEEFLMKDMKKEIKWYKENITELEKELKNMKSALLIMTRQNKQMKMELTRHRIQNDSIGEELLYLLKKFGNNPV